MACAQGPFFTFDPRHTGLSGTPEIRFSPDGRTIAVLSLLGEGSDAKSGGSTGDDAHSSKPFYMGSSVIMLDAFATGDAGAVRVATAARCGVVQPLSRAPPLPADPAAVAAQPRALRAAGGQRTAQARHAGLQGGVRALSGLDTRRRRAEPW